MTRVAVIGGGAAGLAAVSYLINEPGVEVTLFEERSEYGGVWTNQATNTQPNPMYDGLETNVPHTLMTFTDQKWPRNTPMFPPHEDVRTYLRTYAEEKLLGSDQLIHFLCQRVAEVCYIRGKWKITTEGTYVNLQDSFDRVVIAAGNYSDPYITDEEPGRTAWLQSGYPIFHSSRFKDAEFFTDKVDTRRAFLSISVVC